MTDLLHDVDAPSDAELISRVRGGDVAAYGDLFSRHVDAAKRLARQLVRGPDADDLVSDAFAKVLSVLQGGGGPDVAFRAYLLTAVRRLHVDKIRSGARLQTSDDMEAFDAGVPFQDTAVAAFESGAAAKAFASLPERWQLVLWHLEVEGQKPADIAPLLGMSANSVSALAYRAREGQRQAFLTMHLNDISETDCRWVNEHLGAYVRNGLAKRDSVKVRAHLDDCRRCTAMYLELTEVNSNLAGIIAPLLLGAAATGYLASAGSAAGGFGLTAVFGRVRDLVSANAGVATAGAVAAGVAAAATAGILLLPSSSPDVVAGADRPAQTVSTPPAGTGGGDKPAGDKKDRKPSSEKTTAGPATLLPSELPSVSDSPAPVVAFDQGTTTTGDGTATADGTGGGTAPGDTSNPPGDQTSSPTDPTEPAPTEPAPTEPAPTQPTEPAPTQPTEPAPTQPTQPAPTETTAPPPPAEPPPPPTEPPPVTYTLQVNGSRIENG
ncbi:MAG: sigma-70 family RNA polymerase sigma factor, partial [Nocardioides sp.]